jgi:hypothetical protein
MFGLSPTSTTMVFLLTRPLPYQHQDFCDAQNKTCSKTDLVHM